MKLKVLSALISVGLLGTLAIAKEAKQMNGTVAKSVALKKEEKVIVPLFNGPFKVMGIGLSKGQKLEKHLTPTAAFLYVESGRVTFSMGDRATNLAAGDYFSIPAKELHEVTADEDSRLMLIK
ncbi:MAG: cupin domain-containing protein [Bdellovibrionales bacterium]|nr:cupin domain-containing protein [Bdellovibrionales bacterium]